MSSVSKHHSDCDFLVFFLTTKVSSEIRKKLLQQLERGGEFKDRIITVDWPYKESGSEEDIKRLLYQASIEEKPFQSDVVGFFDDQTEKDNTILMVESIEMDGHISRSRRMLAHYTPIAAVTCSLALLTLAEVPEED